MMRIVGRGLCGELEIGYSVNCRVEFVWDLESGYNMYCREKFVWDIGVWI